MPVAGSAVGTAVATSSAMAGGMAPARILSRRLSNGAISHSTSLPRATALASTALPSATASHSSNSYAGTASVGSMATAGLASMAFARRKRGRMALGPRSSLAPYVACRAAATLPRQNPGQRPSDGPLEELAFFRGSGDRKVEVCTTRADQWRGDALVLFMRARPDGEEGPPELGRVGEMLDKDSMDGNLAEFVAEESFEAKEGTSKVLRVFGKDMKQVVLVGVGNKGKGEVDWRLAGATAAGALREMKSEATAGLACIDKVNVQALVEGLLLGLHKDARFRGSKTPEKEKAGVGPGTMELLGAFPPGSASAIDSAQAIASGVNFARELVNASPNVVTPPSLTAAAVDLAEKVGLKATILDLAACEKLGMGSFLAVSRCSDLPPSLIHLTYTPAGDAPTRKVGIVGKGLTFDAGGYNLKAGAGSMIEMMKFDMGGSAAVLGAAAAIGQLKPKDVEVHFVIATCENMISGNPGSLRPGDIITAMDGTTIEVNNTDAEGRLTMADALCYIQDQGVTEVMDVATLTGACMVALGQGITGVWSNSDDLAARIDSCSKAVGEKTWRMPLEETYWEGMKSDFADMKNTGPRFGGAITAALFLQKFIKEGTSWAHIDIAGTIWAEKPKGLNPGVGGTGVMVRTLTEMMVGKK